MTSHITDNLTVCSTVYSGQQKQSSELRITAPITNGFLHKGPTVKAQKLSTSWRHHFHCPVYCCFFSLTAYAHNNKIFKGPLTAKRSEIQYGEDYGKLGRHLLQQSARFEIMTPLTSRWPWRSMLHQGLTSDCVIVQLLPARNCPEVSPSLARSATAPQSVELCCTGLPSDFCDTVTREHNICVKDMPPGGHC